MPSPNAPVMASVIAAAKMSVLNGSPCGMPSYVCMGSPPSGLATTTGCVSTWLVTPSQAGIPPKVAASCAMQVSRRSVPKAFRKSSCMMTWWGVPEDVPGCGATS